jgi:hypothetical protein
MVMRATPRILTLGLGLLAAGCNQLAEQGVVNDEDPLTAQNGLSTNGLSTNGLSTNGISSNGISSNGLSTNGLSTNGLSTNGISSNGLVMDALRDTTSLGANSRIFFRYLVSCALPAGQTVTYNWTDANNIVHTEDNPGQLGLAPAWQTGPLDQAGKEIVSACMASRTNSLGVTVPISMRSKGVAALAVSSSERSQYTYGEGSFWGDLFASTPYLYSCSRAPYDAGTSTSQYTSKGRTCAAADCGIIKYLGRCLASDSATSNQACYERDKTYNDWSSNCHSTMNKSTGTAANHVITTWLLP